MQRGTDVTQYEYNGDGDRVAETVGGVRTEFTLDVASSLTNVLAETTNGQTISYIYGLGLVGEMKTSVGMAEYHLTDALGSVRQLTDPGGRVLLSQSFDPYGNPFERFRGDVLWDTQSPFGWTGEQSDPNGLTYLRARYYAPSMGRFTQPDPFAGALALPASMNGYGYAHGNPTRYTDPSGEVIPLLIALAALAIGGFAVGISAGYGYEVHQNMQQGMGFWDAAYYKNINWGVVGAGGAIGTVAAPAVYLGLQALPGIAGQALGQAAAWEATGGVSLNLGITAYPYVTTAGSVIGVVWDIYTALLIGRELTGIYPPSLEEKAEFAAVYLTGLQTAIWSVPASKAASAEVRLALSGVTENRVAKAVTDLLNELAMRSHLNNVQAVWDSESQRIVMDISIEDTNADAAANRIAEEVLEIVCAIFANPADISIDILDVSHRL